MIKRQTNLTKELSADHNIFFQASKLLQTFTILFRCSAPIGQNFTFSVCVAHTTPHESTVQHIIRTHGWLHFIHLSLHLMERGTKRNQLWAPMMSTAMTLSFGSSKFIKVLRVTKMLMGKSLTVRVHQYRNLLLCFFF